MTEENNVVEINAKAEEAKKQVKIAEKLAGYQMRELMADDIFEVLEICEKLDVADKVIEFMEERDKAAIKTEKIKGYALIAAKDTENESKVKEMQEKIAKVQEELSEDSFKMIGKVVKLVLANLDTIRPELNGMLAKLTGKSADEIGKMPLVTYILLIKAFFAKPELKELFELLI